MLKLILQDNLVQLKLALHDDNETLISAYVGLLSNHIGTFSDYVDSMIMWVQFSLYAYDETDTFLMESVINAIDKIGGAV